MENIDYQKIKERVDEILIEYDMYKKAPINVFKICKIKNIKVQLVKFKENNVCAAIHKVGDSYNIFVNHMQSPLEQRVSIAHELGHYYLHQDILDKEMLVDMYKRFSSREEKEEKEAEYFANCLLLEENSLKTLWGKVEDVNDLANMFKVPLDFLKERLVFLKLLDE